MVTVFINNLGIGPEVGRWSLVGRQYSYFLHWLLSLLEISLVIGLDFAADCMGLSSFNFYSGELRKKLGARVTFWPFKVIKAHWFWYQSKARMRLPISPS